MYRRARRIVTIASPIVGLGVWSGWVWYDRRKEPQNIRFEIGSPDDILSEQLTTGDVLLFSRRMFQMMPFASALSVAKRQVVGTRFDHAAVIVNDRFGIPHVAELTYTGVKLRRYDERMIRSRCDQILLVPVNFDCSEETRAKTERFVKGMTLRPFRNNLSSEFLGLIKLLFRPARGQEKNEVEEKGATTDDDDDDAEKSARTAQGSTTGTGDGVDGKGQRKTLLETVGVNPSVLFVMSCLDAAGVVDLEEIGRQRSQRSLTCKDFEDAVVPLREGAHFGQALPVRIHD